MSQVKKHWGSLSEKRGKGDRGRGVECGWCRIEKIPRALLFKLT